MKISFARFPLDLIICFVWSAILVPLVMFNVENFVRLIFGIPFLLFIPGYILVFVLFPFKRREEGISVIERIALSVGVSVSIVPLIGLGLNFSPWGINLQPLLIVLIGFIFCVGLFALYRWYKLNPTERFYISLDISHPAFENRYDSALTLILITLIIISLILLLYAVLTPKIGEKFTEFYVLGPTGKADQYPQNLSAGRNTSVILGISNHEYRTINYIVDVWLVNQTTIYNTTDGKNDTIIHHLWYLDRIHVKLNHTSVNLETPYQAQWEYNYSFSIEKTGSFKLVFLLFTAPVYYQYGRNMDFVNMANQILDNAHRELHLWITVH